MNLGDQSRIFSFEKARKEQEKIMGDCDFFPLYQSELFIESFDESLPLKGSYAIQDVHRFGMKLSRLREAGVPILSLLEKVDLEHYLLKENGLKSEIILDMLVICMDDNLALDEKIKRFIMAEFGDCLRYNNRIKGISTTEVADHKGISLGNYYGIVSLAIQREFHYIPKHLLQPNFLKALIQDAIRQYNATETPYQEILRYYEKYKGNFPKLETPAPESMESATGPWKETLNAFEGLFSVYGLTKHHEREIMLRSLLTMTERTIKPGTESQWAMVLQGPGDTCKTGFGKIMALDSAPAYVTNPSELPKRRTLEEMEGASFVVVDEMDTAGSKHDIAANKSWLTSSSWNIRKAFREDAQPLKATWATIFTLNPETIPYDDGAEMRRYCMVRIKGNAADGRKRAKFLLDNREYLHAALFHIHQAGYSATKPLAYEEEVRQDALGFVEVSQEVSIVEAYQDQLIEILCSASGSLIPVTTKELFELVSSDRYHSRRAAKLTAALKAWGWDYRRLGPNEPFFWEPPNLKRTSYTLSHLLPGTKSQVLRQLQHNAPQSIKVEPETPSESPATSLNPEICLLPPEPVKGASESQQKALESLAFIIRSQGIEPLETNDPQVMLDFWRCIQADNEKSNSHPEVSTN